MPVDSNIVLSINNILVAALRIRQPGSQVLLTKVGIKTSDCIDVFSSHNVLLAGTALALAQ